MTYNSVFLSAAYEQFLEAWLWYEDKQPGLGDRFKKEVYSLIHIITQHPERYVERRQYYREAMVKVFPYLLIYRIHKKKKIITITSVFTPTAIPC